VVLFVALVAVAGGCGGESYKGLSKAEFLKRANRACENPTKAGQELRKQMLVEQDENRMSKLWLEDVLPPLEREVDRIADLKPPKADRGKVKEILELTRDDIDAFTESLEKDPNAALAPGVDPFDKSRDAATKYGLKICVA